MLNRFLPLLFIAATVSVAFTASVSFTANADTIVLSDAVTGTYSETLEEAKPEAKGIVLHRALKLPAFKRGAYFGGGWVPTSNVLGWPTR